MSNIRFPGIIRAVRARGDASKDVAEQLLIEIPPVGKGRRPKGTPTVEQLLRLAVEEIVRETGESEYSVKTLEEYRWVAMWAAEGAGWKSPVHGAFPWADASWTAHKDAYDKGIPWADFTAGKRSRRAKSQAGRAVDAGDVVREQGGDALVSALTPHQQLEVRRALNKRDQDRVETMRLENEKFGKHVKRDDIDAPTRRINPRHPDADVLSDMTSPGAIGRVIDRAGALLHSAGLHWSDVDIEERDHVRERIRMVRVEVGVLEMYAFDIIPGMDEEP